jgi:hypothetical protein
MTGIEQQEAADEESGGAGTDRQIDREQPEQWRAQQRDACTSGLLIVVWHGDALKRAPDDSSLALAQGASNSLSSFRPRKRDPGIHRASHAAASWMERWMERWILGSPLRRAPE